jgi:hypothetical protein
MYRIEKQLKFEDFVFPYGKLDKNNRWVKLTNEIQWNKIEELYAKQFVNNGNEAKNVRIALGSLIIKQTLNCSDVETVNQVKENPYLQYFIGLKEYTTEAPFSSQSMVEFRKRFSEDNILEKINDIVINDQNDNNNNNNNNNNDDDNKPNSGKIAIDATCAPADIAFPQDLGLLNQAREKAEEIIDELHKTSSGKKPRTYRKQARQNFLKVSKSKNRTMKVLRKALKKQLCYLNRDLLNIEKMINAGGKLTTKQTELLSTIKKLYEQQKQMIDNKKHSVADRIVSISQPYVRPIPRGKAKAKTEFGAKVEVSIVNGFARIETLDFNAFNEGGNLIKVIEKYKGRYGFYPESVLVDKLYRNRENIKFCNENGIKITGPALGRPKKNTDVDKKQEYKDICDRNCIEGKFGEGKTAYGLDRISARLEATSKCVIGMIFLVMNLNKRLRNLLLQFLKHVFTVIFIDFYRLENSH